MERVLVWGYDDPFAGEAARVAVDDGMAAAGVAIGVDPVAYVLEYRIEWGPGLVLASFAAATSGAGWSRELELSLGAGGWSVSSAYDGEVHLPPPGCDPADLHAATDVDLGRSPLTNTPPIVRGDSRLVVAWVSVPSLFVKPARQAYTRLDASHVRYESVDSAYTAELTVDADGFVTDYPGLARRRA